MASKKPTEPAVNPAVVSEVTASESPVETASTTNPEEGQVSVDDLVAAVEAEASNDSAEKTEDTPAEAAENNDNTAPNETTPEVGSDSVDEQVAANYSLGNIQSYKGIGKELTDAGVRPQYGDGSEVEDEERPAEYPIGTRYRLKIATALAPQDAIFIKSLLAGNEVYAYGVAGAPSRQVFPVEVVEGSYHFFEQLS